MSETTKAEGKVKAPTSEEIAANLRRLRCELEAMIDAEGEVCVPLDVFDAKLREWEAVQPDAVAKLGGLAYFLKSFGYREKALASEKRDLDAKLKGVRGAIGLMKLRAEVLLCEAQVRSVAGHTATVFLKANPESVEVADLESVPEAWLYPVEERRVKKEAALPELKAGRDIPGLRIAAASEHVEVR